MPNRTLCAVLDEMRKAYETRNFSYLVGLIEEAQSMGNKMEAALYDKHDYNSLKDAIKKLEKQRLALKEEIENAKEPSTNSK